MLLIVLSVAGCGAFNCDTSGPPPTMTSRTVTVCGNERRSRSDFSRRRSWVFTRAQVLEGAPPAPPPSDHASFVLLLSPRAINSRRVER